MPGLITATIAVDPISTRSAEEGLYLRFVLAGERFSAIALDGKAPRGPVAVFTPVDPLLHDRVDALFRFRDALIDDRARADIRLTAQRRRHLIEMLRAIDGRRAGATYQDIAEAVFGAERESATLWKSMPLRDVVMRRVRTGFDLVAGGYRTLFYKRRAR